MPRSRRQPPASYQTWGEASQAISSVLSHARRYRNQLSILAHSLGGLFQDYLMRTGADSSTFHERLTLLAQRPLQVRIILMGKISAETLPPTLAQAIQPLLRNRLEKPPGHISLYVTGPTPAAATSSAFVCSHPRGSAGPTMLWVQEPHPAPQFISANSRCPGFSFQSDPRRLPDAARLLRSFHRTYHLLTQQLRNATLTPIETLPPTPEEPA